MGILVPHVHTAAEAEQAAIAARYPPVGTLSAPGSIPQFGYRKVPLNEAAERFNREVLADLSQAVIGDQRDEGRVQQPGSIQIAQHPADLSVGVP